MRRRDLILGLGLLCLGLVVGIIIANLWLIKSSFIPPLKISGDVEKALIIQDFAGLGVLEQVRCQGLDYQAIKLSDILKNAKPYSKAKQIHLISSLDGFSAVLPAEDLNECYVTFSSQNGWEAVNPKHPNSSNGKYLTDIVVVSDGSLKSSVFQVLDQENDLLSVTPGELLTQALLNYPYDEGQAVVENDGKKYTSQVVTWRKTFQINDLSPLQEGERMLVVGAGGDSLLTDSSGYFEVRDNVINYLIPTTRTKLDKVQGVVLRPPTANIMDVYYDTRHHLENNDPVLVITIDGLTYEQYSYASANGYTPYLNQIGKATKALGVFPLAAQTGWSAMLTGQTPAENGIVTGQEKNLQSTTIFGEAQKLKKQAIYLLTTVQRPTIEITPQIYSDQNSDGNADDELFTQVVNTIVQNPDLMLVCFNDVAVHAHKYGHIAQETMQAISTTDQYLTRIIGQWTGKVIIAGLPNTTKYPDSSTILSSEVMFIPYWSMSTKS